MTCSTTVKLYYKDMSSFYTNNKPNIYVREGNIFDIAKEYYNPAIHNFANNTMPGGHYSTFSPSGRFIKTKEYGCNQESLIIKHYRNKIYLPKSYYPIITKEVALLYSTCQDLPAVISLPPVIKPKLTKRSVYESILDKLELLMYAACLNNNTLITGLWGCDINSMNPEELASLWEIALKRYEYKPISIVFVINNNDVNNNNVNNYDKIYDLFMELN